MHLTALARQIGTVRALDMQVAIDRTRARYFTPHPIDNSAGRNPDGHAIAAPLFVRSFHENGVA